LSPKIFDPEVITVEEDSNICNTKLAVVAELFRVEVCGLDSSDQDY
jgi:hypothetical protein